MRNLFAFMKSTRSLAVVIVLLSLSIGLFMGIVDPKDYTIIAGSVITAYFGRRDEKSNSKNEPSE